jgi:putative flippase GtrA
VVRPDVVASSSGGLAGLVNTALRREQIRYLVVAGSTSACYLGILAVLLATGLPYMIAILIAQAIIIAVAFPVYRRLIFRSTGRWQHDLPRFVGVWSGGFIAGIVATPALVEFAGQPPLLAQVIAVAAVAVLSYLGHKFVSFRR